MKRALLVVIGCSGSPKPAPPIVVSQVVVDAATVDAASPDAAPPDAAPPAEAAPACTYDKRLRNAPIVRVRVKDVFDAKTETATEAWARTYVELEIVEVVSGDLTKVLPAFRKSFYVSRTNAYGRKGGGFGEGGRDLVVDELENSVGKERTMQVILPRKGDDDEPDPSIPKRLRDRYGSTQRAHVHQMCPEP